MIGRYVADGELAPLVFANIRNGLPLPVYLRRPKHAAGKAASELVRALRVAGDENDRRGGERRHAVGQRRTD